MKITEITELASRMRDRKQAIAALLFCLLSAGCTTSRDSIPRDQTTAFVHVNLIPMDRERVFRDQTVIVEDGLIATIGPTDATALPRNARVIEGDSHYLMPGLADMHVHLMNEGETDPALLRLFLANGVTTIRNMHGSPGILDLRERIEQGDLAGPRIYTTGPILDGDPAFWQGSVPIKSPGEAEAAVAAQKAAGYDGIKVLANLSPEVYESVLRAAAAHGLPVYGHVPTRVGLREVLPQGQRSIEHMGDFMVALLPDDSPVRTRVIAFWSKDEPGNPEVGRHINGLSPPYASVPPGEIRTLAERVAEAGVWLCPTVTFTRRVASDPEEFAALQQASWLRYAGEESREIWDGIARRMSTEPGEPTAQKRSYRKILDGVGAMHEEGVPLLLGTDSPGLFIVAGFSAHEELALLVEAGLKPFEALAAATRDAAEFLNASETFGTVQVGKSADLILVRRNPLENVEHASELAGVMARGSWFSEHALRHMLEDVARRYRGTAAAASIPEGEDRSHRTGKSLDPRLDRITRQ